MYISESIQAYKIPLKSYFNFNGAAWCRIETHGGKYSVGVVYNSLATSEDDDEKLHNAIVYI